MIIDSHQHFWNYNPKRDKWINNNMNILKQDFLPKDLRIILDKEKVQGSIAIQADQSENESLFLLDCASKNSFIKGVVGWVDLCSEEVDRRLEFFSSNKLFKGVRHIVQAEKDNFLLREDFQRGISKLSKFNLTFDLLIYPHQLDAAIKLVKRFPKQKFVLDHIAKPKISESMSEKWVFSIIELSKSKNVFCKLSGMVTETLNFKFNEKEFTPFIDIIFQNFGSDRIMFGSDWPVCLLAANYKKVIQIVKNYFEDKNENIKNKIFAENALAFYNLEK